MRFCVVERRLSVKERERPSRTVSPAYVDAVTDNTCWLMSAPRVARSSAARSNGPSTVA